MYVMAINHTIEEWGRWKAVFDTFPPGERGATFHRVNRSVDDENNVTVVAGFPTLEAAFGFRDDPELKEAMGRAGVNSAPRIEIYEEVEAVQY